MPTTLTGTETSDSGYQNSGGGGNVCVHAQPNRGGLAACFDAQMSQAAANRSKGFKTSNKLSVMMLMPGIAAAFDRPELYYTAAGGSANTLGFELRKRSNSFTQGQTTANFLSQLENEHIHHHQQMLYQPPFIFNSEVAQRTVQQQQQQQSNNVKQTDRNADRQRVSRQTSEQSDQQTDQLNDQTSDETNQSTDRPPKKANVKGNKVNFDLPSTNVYQSDEDEDAIAKELNNNSEPKSQPDDEMTAELASQCSVQMVMQTSGEQQDEESQI